MLSGNSVLLLAFGAAIVLMLMLLILLLRTRSARAQITITGTVVGAKFARPVRLRIEIDGHTMIDQPNTSAFNMNLGQYAGKGKVALFVNGEERFTWAEG